MKKIVVVIMILFFNFQIAHGADQWSLTYSGNERDSIESVQQTEDGGYIIAGWTNNWDSNNYFWLLKLYASGNVVWRKAYGDRGDFTNSAFSLLQTADREYLVAYTRSFGAGNEDIQLLKLNENGDMRWQKKIGGSGNDKAFCVRQTQDSGYIIAGWTNKSFNALNYDMLLVKLNESGEIDWQKTYGGGGSDQGTAIEQTADGGYIMAGWTYSFGQGECVSWVLRLSKSGDVVWQKTFGEERPGHTCTVRQAADEGYLLERRNLLQDHYAITVFELSAQGDIQREKTYSGNYRGAFNQATCAQRTADGGYIIAGWSRSASADDRNAWTLRAGRDGEVLWQKIYGGGEEDYAEAVQQTRDGGYIMAGWTYSFGTGGRNIWMLKLDGQGDITGPELFETRQAFADDYLLLTVPARTMTGVLKKITFTVDRQKRLSIYVSGPPGCHYIFPESYTRKIQESLIKALEQFENKQNTAGPIANELGSFADNKRSLRIVYRKDPFSNSNISLSLVNENRFKAGETQSLVVAPEEIKKIIDALKYE